MIDLRKYRVPLTGLLAIAALAVPANAAIDVHEDYYRGFAQGAYYGLMLAGVDYHVAWCMKAELEYEAANLGTGGEFQRRLESLLATCREQTAVDQPAALRRP